MGGWGEVMLQQADWKSYLGASMPTRNINNRIPLPACLVLILFALSVDVSSQEDVYRIWKDSTGKYQIDAALISQSSSHVILKNREGKQIEVALDKLSASDLEFLKKSNQTPTASKPNGGSDEMENSQELKLASGGLDTDQMQLKQMAEDFFNDLRTKDRKASLALLTEKAKTLVSVEKSALAHLPSPDKGPRAIRIGKPTILEEEASVVVTVVVSKTPQKTMLEFKKDSGQWRIFSISATRGDSEVTVDFETAYDPGESKNGTNPNDSSGPLEITGLTLDGRKISLSDYKGKVVLIDFWATWCGPCLKEIPNVYQNYAMYHKRGFEVLAVSLDKNMDDIQEFIAKNNPPWPILADMHPNNPVKMAAKYNVRAIPTMILVGPDGKIIDPNCRGERLNARLAELFR